MATQQGSQPKLFKAFRELRKDGVVKKFLEVYDDLDNSWGSKIRVQISEFPQGGEGRVVHHSINVDEMRVLCRLILANRLGKRDEAKQYEEYKGGPNPKGEKGYHSPTGMISRHLTFEKDVASRPGKSIGTAAVYTISIENGPGEKGDKGQVTPVRGQGDPIRVQFTITEQEAMTMAAKIEHYLQSWLTCNFNDVRERMTEVREEAPSGDPAPVPNDSDTDRY